MVIDLHAHIFPAELAEKASRNIGAFYKMPMRYDGSVASLLAKGRRCGVDRFVVHSAATSPAQVEPINRFIAASVKKAPEQLIGFGTLHPESETLEEDLKRLRRRGLLGVKLHPDFQAFYLDSPAAMRMFALLEGTLPVLVHTGDRRSQYSKASRLAAIAAAFPKLDLIAAHFGGFSEWEDGALALAEAGVYTDTSSSQFALKPHQVRELIDIYGADKVMFGSDYPMWDAGEELAGLASIPMTPAERAAVYGGNVQRLLKKYAE